MGQKVTPTGFRLGITYKPQSQWFVDPRSGSMKKIYPPLILEDRFIRDFITQKFPRTAIAQILIYRTLDYIKIEIHTAQAKKLSYQSANKSSTEFGSSVWPSNKFEGPPKTNSNQNNSSNQTQASSDVSLQSPLLQRGQDGAKGGTQENNTQIEHQSFTSSRETTNRSSLPSVGHSNLKNLQQDLQIALLKYKKTLQIFSSWKNESFYKNNDSLNNEKTNLLEDETQELPKLWSYNTNNFAGTRNNHSSSTIQSNSTQTKGVNENENNYDRESLSEKERVEQHIGIVVKQLNQPFQYASIFAKYLVSQLERRENSVKQALNRSLKLIQNYNIQGIKIKVSGRLNGVDMAETEKISKGRIPLSTISANIDYYQDIAQTLYGTLGVKVFIYR